MDVDDCNAGCVGGGYGGGVVVVVVDEVVVDNVAYDAAWGVHGMAGVGHDSRRDDGRRSTMAPTESVVVRVQLQQSPG